MSGVGIRGPLKRRDFWTWMTSRSGCCVFWQTNLSGEILGNILAEANIMAGTLEHVGVDVVLLWLHIGAVLARRHRTDIFFACSL